MKLKNLSDIKKQFRTEQSIRDFLERCTVTEKLDTHYVKVKILGPGNISCCKSTGNIVTQVDCIINAMWARFIEDFNIIRNNQGFREFCDKYKGCVLNFFYIPCRKPLGTSYKIENAERVYILSQCYDSVNQTEHNLHVVYNELTKIFDIKEVHPRFSFKKQNFFKVGDIDKLIEKINISDFSSIKECFAINDKTIYAESGFDEISLVFSDNKNYFQINKECSGYIKDTEYTSYEYVLCDFLDYWKQNHERLIPGLRGTYRYIICTMFNDYILNWESKNKKIENNILPDVLVPAKFGYDHGDCINQIYVPNRMTLKLCAENLLYRNIFKILLVNLQQYKNFKYCVYMNKRQVREINQIALTIKQIKNNL